MFSNILIQTDGSDFPAEAVEQGVLFAKEIGAKITAVVVTEPFHLLSASPSQLEGRHMGRPPSLTPAQKKEAIRPRVLGATLQELAHSYNVSRARFRG
jgi:nucleotide-binding universal stress UspA family protein